MPIETIKMVTELSQILLRDLGRLHAEISAFDSEEKLWIKKEGINNTAGNLSLHIAGNLQHFIGHVLGKSSFQRNREAEFNGQASRSVLLSEIENTNASVASTLQKLSEEDLKANFPIEVLGHPMSTEYFLIHLIGHLNYHLGQINYYRRLN